jgi:NRAMP (natural resistance-associated macrophage protein)-like metal ion transporter
MKNQHPNIIIQPIRKAGKVWQNLGPGFITGAADDDPSGITTYAQSGAKFGFNFLWLAPYTFPLMAIVQEMCAKIGMVTGRGLAGNIKKYYSKSFLILITGLLFFANIFNIGANLGAMAEAVKLIFPKLDFYFLTSTFVIFSLLLQIFSSYKTYSQILKWLALFLLAYVFSAFYAGLDGKEIFTKGFLPNREIFSKQGIVLLCAFLGTTISPYLFFWQTSQEVEEEILEGKTTLKARQSPTLPREIKKMQIDVWVGMFFSNLIAFFIIATTASVLNHNGIFNIQSAGEVALALEPLAGKWAATLFTIGILGTGMLSIPVLAGSCSYALSETFGWKSGLYKTLKQAKAFYGTIIIAMILGFCMNLIGINPIKALIFSAIINGLVAPFILIPIVQISSNHKIMNDFTNSKSKQIFGWAIIGLMFLVGLASVVSFWY